MKIKILGTGTSQGVPIIGCTCDTCLSKNPKDKRLRSSIYIETDTGEKLLIDTSPDLRTQFLNNDITDVDAVIYTHEHNDHVIGLEDIRPVYFIRKKAIPLYGAQRVLDSLKVRFDYLFTPTDYPGILKIETIAIEGKSIRIGDTDITIIPVLHGKMEVFGFRIGKFAYLTDVKHIPRESYALLEGLDVLIINALMQKPHYSHLSLDEAIIETKKIGAKKNYFTHVSHYMGKYDEVNPQLPANTSFAFDGQILEL